MTDTFRKKYNNDPKLLQLTMDIKNMAEYLEIKFKEIGPSREMSLALTKLEESVMWALKATYNPI